MNVRMFFAVCAAFFATTEAFGQANSTPLPVPAIEKVLQNPVFRHAVVGVWVRSLPSGNEVFVRNGETALMPASNQKLLTGWAVLCELGQHFRYQTTVYATGSVDERGVLTGDLYLRGSGDPSLTKVHLADLAGELKRRGVRRFGGAIYADATCFDEKLLGEGWQWDDEAADYSPQVSGLNCDENVVAVTIQPGAKVGEPARISADELDVLNYVRIENRAVTVEGGAETARFLVDRTRGKNEIVITGTVGRAAKPDSVYVTVEDPARCAATRFYAALGAAGVEIPSAGERIVREGITPATAKPFAMHESAPLSELLRLFLQPSDNLFGECFLKTLGKEKGKTGSSTEGAKIIRALFKKQNITDDGLFIADGSGLSRMNLVTPRLIVDLLTAIDKSDAKVKDVFVNALPQSGVSGTLRNRFKGTIAEKNVRAKTGTLFGVSSLSGFATTKGGERFVFAVLMNHWSTSGRASEVRAAQDAIVLALFDVQTPPGSVSGHK